MTEESEIITDAEPLSGMTSDAPAFSDPDAPSTPGAGAAGAEQAAEAITEGTAPERGTPETVLETAPTGEEAAETGEPAPEVETSEEPEPASEAAILETLARIEGRLEETQRLIGRQAEVSAKLHAENQVLRGGELRKAQGALVLSVLRVYDDVNRMVETTEDPAMRNDLTIVADALEDALARNGIETVQTALGEAFSPSKHKIASIELTTDEDADRTVARSVRPGFAWADGDTVRVSEVAVYKFAASNADTSAANAPDTTASSAPDTTASSAPATAATPQPAPNNPASSTPPPTKQ